VIPQYRAVKLKPEVVSTSRQAPLVSTGEAEHVGVDVLLEGLILRLLLTGRRFQHVGIKCSMTADALINTAYTDTAADSVIAAAAAV
jgi:hypothetical protein